MHASDILKSAKLVKAAHFGRNKRNLDLRLRLDTPVWIYTWKHSLNLILKSLAQHFLSSMPVLSEQQWHLCIWTGWLLTDTNENREATIRRQVVYLICNKYNFLTPYNHLNSPHLYKIQKNISNTKGGRIQPRIQKIKCQTLPRTKKKKNLAN